MRIFCWKILIQLTAGCYSRMQKFDRENDHIIDLAFADLSTYLRERKKKFLQMIKYFALNMPKLLLMWDFFMLLWLRRSLICIGLTILNHLFIFKKKISI